MSGLVKTKIIFLYANIFTQFGISKYFLSVNQFEAAYVTVKQSDFWYTRANHDYNINLKLPTKSILAEAFEPILFSTEDHYPHYEIWTSSFVYYDMFN